MWKIWAASTQSENENWLVQTRIHTMQKMCLRKQTAQCIQLLVTAVHEIKHISSTIAHCKMLVLFMQWFELCVYQIQTLLTNELGISKWPIRQYAYYVYTGSIYKQSASIYSLTRNYMCTMWTPYYYVSYLNKR